jgi:class 3 adenylate cyclase/tetratricopeptide (TPR) repeat protein
VTIGAHRKVVTVLFCDVVGSTALGESADPEALQALLARYFERMSGIVESYGGSVEKFIGDAVMAVFGVPVAHEDDALRACRAAVEMRDVLPELGVQGRIGVNTGEVLTGTEERLATGDAVNVAARLEQAAEPGEVLIGTETLGLVGAAVEVGDERQLDLKGKSEPVAAYALVLVNEAAERSHASRFVGRARELQQLVDAWDRALAGPRCELVTVVGDPGVGKSRLVAEALAQIDARVVRGRCLSYGEGITYWPVVEVLKQIDARPDDEHAARAIGSLLGESETLVGTDEIAWAFRKLLEAQAPLVVCFDDIQWGEETFLELIESTALLSAGAPLLILCMARPELLDRRPGWPATLRLEPLAAEEAESLVGDAVQDEVRARIVRAAGGNPLFVTEMLALAGEESDVEVPATLRALLAARLDQLDGPERTVLERGAVEGELFHRGTVQALAPEQTEVTPRLAALVKRDLVRPDRPQLPREDAYRFRHLLIRDAAYEALPKATRAELHRRFAEWLEQHGQSLVELDEILGYHLEQAACYLDELGRPNLDLLFRAGQALKAAGHRARGRGDITAAARLFERALHLTRPHRLEVHLELDLIEAISEPGRQADVATAAAERAVAAGDELGALALQVVAAGGRFEQREGSAEEFEQLVRAALPRLEEVEDHQALIAVWQAAATLAIMRLQFEEMAHAIEQAIHHARAAGVYGGFTFGLASALLWGPRPASEALQTLDDIDPGTQNPSSMGYRAVLLAMLGRFDEARQLAQLANERMQEYGRGEEATWTRALIGEIAGNNEDAAEEMGRFCDHLETLGRNAELSTFAPGHARYLCALGRYDEAEFLARKGKELGDPNDWATQVAWRQAQALIDVHRGRPEDAERHAREAVAMDLAGDSLWQEGNSYCVLADVLAAAGRREEAVATWQEALACYDRKQVIPVARRLRERLSAMADDAFP